MKAIYLLAAVIALILSSSEEAHPFGTKLAHHELGKVSITRADSEKRISAYVREQLGLRRGVDEPLAIQFGLDPAIDDDLIVADDPTTPDKIETRLNRSLSRYDEDENGNSAEFPLAPKEVRVFFRENCRAAPDFDTCFAALPRADVRKLIRIGTYAEDNPNPRARHHFHDPERSRPVVGHGLENSNGLTQSLLGTLSIEGVTASGRGGSWLNGMVGVLR